MNESKTYKNAVLDALDKAVRKCSGTILNTSSARHARGKSAMYGRLP